MRAVLLLCAALVSMPALSQNLVARQGEDTIRLGDAPCSDESVLNNVPPQFREEFMSASAVVQGHAFAACWRKAGSAAHLVYEDGDQGILPLSDLKEEMSA
jgi:hypothetical protein